MIKEQPINESLTDEQKKEEQKEILRFFKNLEPLGDVFVGTWGYHTKIDPDAPTNYFRHDTREVGMSLQSIERFKPTEDEKEWVFGHELGHLVQLFQDSDSYLEIFEVPKRKAAQAGKEGKDIGAQKFVQDSWQSFYNSMYDIHDNSIVIRRTPKFQKGETAEDIRRKRYEKLFPLEDYSGDPFSSQFSNVLLRKTMIPEVEIKVSKEVQKVLEDPIMLFGKKYASAYEFAEKELFNPGLKIDDVVFRIKEVLAPLFEDLLKKDIAASRINIAPEKINIDAEFGEDIIRDILNNHQKVLQSSSDRFQDAQNNKFKEWASGEKFSDEEISRMMEIKDKTLKSVEDLEQLWENFIQRSADIFREKKMGYKTGSGISTEALMSQLPLLLTQPSEAEIFYRYNPEEEREFLKPKKISLYLAVDLSGSMSVEKRNAVQDVTYSLGKSLINFYRNSRLAVADMDIDAPITINIQIDGFGSRVEELILRTPQEKRERALHDQTSFDIDKRLWDAVFDIQRKDFGGTEDSLALEKIERDFTPEVKNAADIYCRAIQIPGAIYNEEELKTDERGNLLPPEVLPPTGTFEEVWGDLGRRLEQLGALKETMVRILYDALRNAITKEDAREEIAVILEITDGETTTVKESKKIIKRLNG